jgi:small subunit ribosomal protein S21
LADVRLQEGETVENALRRFKRQVVQENIIGEVKRHSFYLKPGQKLRVKQHFSDHLVPHHNALGELRANRLPALAVQRRLQRVD